MRLRACSLRTGTRLAPLTGAFLLVVACGPADPGATHDVGSNGDRTGTASVGATNGPAVNRVSITDPVALEGMRVYRGQYCGTCHQSSLAETAGSFGPSHDGLRTTAESRIREAGYSGSATSAEAYVRESLLEPGAYRVPGFEHTRFLMPAYTQLSEAELDALVRLLLWEPTTGGGRP